jgi:hypothetical protein
VATRLIHPPRWYMTPTTLVDRGGHPIGATNGTIRLARSTVLLYTCQRCQPVTHGLVVVSVECGLACGFHINGDQYEAVDAMLDQETETLVILEVLGYHTTSDTREGAA